ncbi:hypothetical protein [Caulobacter sp. 17J80-11]|uniref:hypothetical protein n=1 Tax=Caulobacter sp. 17J80-11 TaxID=2763502 RepID=UPI0016535546|nr:hypothetical protein [Caulobacter sp. 17J80-11]MBC6982878.1 hypothetical protein [Caulobacter sp. 17J80-11]
MDRSRPLIFAAAGFAALLAACGTEAQPACPFEGETAAWTRGALAAWDLVRDTRLNLPPAAPPEIVLFDAACAYRLSAAGSAAPDGYRPLDAVVRTSEGELKVWSAPHSGEVGLPDGKTVRARPLAFAAQNTTGRVFFVMGLPQVWAQTLRGRPPALLNAVFVHEISHVRQVAALGRRLDALTAQGVLPPDADDDIVQKRFGGDPAFSAAVARETDLFYRAAAARDLAETRRLAAEALASIDARRARSFTGESADFAEVEDVFLTFEGAGNWAGYAWLSDPKGASMSREAAMDLMRGGRKWWSQEMGLGLFLTLDRLDPDWPDKVYGEQGAVAVDLLRTALTRT